MAAEPVADDTPCPCRTGDGWTHLVVAPSSCPRCGARPEMVHVTALSWRCGCGWAEPIHPHPQASCLTSIDQAAGDGRG